MKVSAVILLISVAVFVSPAYAKKVEIGQTVTECLAFPEACVSVVDTFLAELKPGEVDGEVAVGLLYARLYEIAGSSTGSQQENFSEPLQRLASWSEVNSGQQPAVTRRGWGWGKNKCGTGVGKNCSPWLDFPGGGWGPPRPPHGSPN
ncbi:MAG: hypothetical protein ACSHXD_14840 [Marinosulfonomonas sp.]